MGGTGTVRTAPNPWRRRADPELADETEANAAELERAGYRMQAVRARLLAVELRIGLGDIDGAERAAGDSRPGRCDVTARRGRHAARPRPRRPCP